MTGKHARNRLPMDLAYYRVPRGRPYQLASQLRQITQSVPGHPVPLGRRLSPGRPGKRPERRLLIVNCRLALITQRGRRSSRSSYGSPITSAGRTCWTAAAEDADYPFARHHGPHHAGVRGLSALEPRSSWACTAGRAAAAWRPMRLSLRSNGSCHACVSGVAGSGAGAASIAAGRCHRGFRCHW